MAAAVVLIGAGCGLLGFHPRSNPTAGATPNPVSLSASSRTPLLEPVSATATRSQNPSSQGENTNVRARSLFAGLPLRFEPNQGQGNLDPADSRAKFVARGSGFGLFLGSQGAILTLLSRDPREKSATRVNAVEMRLSGADPAASVTALDRLPGKSNYFLGNDRSKWRVGVPQFARVRYENVYPGINLVFYGNQGHLEYDFQVAPGADPAKAELEFHGAKNVQVKDGALLISTGEGAVQLEAPRVYQEVAGEKRGVRGEFVLRGANRAGFAVGPYDRSRELIIDPILSFSTYFGGSGDELATSVAVDGSFNIYLAGSTTSPDLPTVAGVYQTALKGSGPNVYVAKIVPPLGGLTASLSYVTYLGGTGQDVPVGIAVDGAQHAYVAGTTSSSDFPTSAQAYQTKPASANQHVFVSELSADATTLPFSTYLSGNGIDLASGMTVNPAGNVFVTGTTTSLETSNSDQFPATSVPIPFQSTSKAPGLPQFFVTVVNPLGFGRGSIVYSTYFGGGTFSTTSPVAVGGGIAVDTNLNVYFTGTTNYTFAGCAGCATTDFPILNAFEPCLDTAATNNIVIAPTCSNTASVSAPDAFVAKLNLNPNLPVGQQLVWSTYLGGTGNDSSTGVALDPGAANVYVVGTTTSSDIASGVTTLATSASFQRCLDTPVNPPAGTACTAPTTTPFPTDAFVARFTNPALSTTATPNIVTLNYFSFLGGTGADAGSAISVDNGSGALVTGWTQSSDFPVVPLSNSVQGTFGGVQDAFVARIYTAAVVGQTTTASWSSYFGGSGTDAGTGIALDINQNTYFAGATNSTNLQVGKPLVAAQGGGYKGGYDAFVTQLGTAMSLSISGSLMQGNNQQSIISAGNQATFTYTITNNGPDLANNVTVLANMSSAVTGVPLTFNSASVSAGTCGGVSTNAIVSCSLPSLQAGSTATLTIVVTPTGTASGTPQIFNGGTVQVLAPGNIVLAQASVPATMSDFTMSVSPLSQSVAVAGSTAYYTVQLKPNPVYTSSITVSCTNLPVSATCRVTPNSSITIASAGATTATVAVTTTARPITGSISYLRRTFYALWFAVPAMFLVGVGGNKRRRKIGGMLMLCALCAMVLLIPACSHTNTQTPVTGTPAGNYTITITAASGSDSKSQSVILTVP